MTTPPDPWTTAPWRTAQTVRAAIIIPVFNHAAALSAVVDGAVATGLPVLIVDDGSTDQTPSVIAAWVRDHPAAPVDVITHRRNQGKAAALRTGFARASARNATHAVTIDADGQHDPRDIPRLLDEAARSPRALVLGSRPVRMDHCPARCALGRRIASLAIHAQTGLRIGDTQCGLRVYPLDITAAIRCRARRYSYEAEIITRAAWAGFEVREIEVGCRYFEGAARVSHWRPVQDSLRQGGVHLRLLAAALMPWTRVHPRPGDRVSRAAGRRMLAWLNPVRSWRELREAATGDLELATGLALGAWIGTLPFYGLHTALSVYAAWRLHLQPAAVVLGAQVSTPPIGVLLAAASIMVGHFLTTGSWTAAGFSEFSWSNAWTLPLLAFGKWLLGSVIVGAFVAALMSLLGLWIGRYARRTAPACDEE